MDCGCSFYSSVPQPKNEDHVRDAVDGNNVKFFEEALENKNHKVVAGLKVGLFEPFLNYVVYRGQAELYFYLMLNKDWYAALEKSFIANYAKLYALANNGPQPNAKITKHILQCCDLLDLNTTILPLISGKSGWNESEFNKPKKKDSKDPDQEQPQYFSLPSS